MRAGGSPESAARPRTDRAISRERNEWLRFFSYHIGRVTALRLVFISMPISRYPSLQSKHADLTKTDNAEAQADQTGEAARRNPEAAILDPERLPTWQRPFVLGPNVRFTRTPHKKHPEPAMPAATETEEAVFGPHLPSPATVLQERIAEELTAARGAPTGEQAWNAKDEQVPTEEEPVDTTEAVED